MTSQDDARLESERSALQERIEDMQNSAFKVFDTHSYFESIVSKASHELEKHVNSLRNTAAKTLQLKDGGQKLKNLLSFGKTSYLCGRRSNESRQSLNAPKCRGWLL